MVRHAWLEQSRWVQEGMVLVVVVLVVVVPPVPPDELPAPAPVVVDVPDLGYFLTDRPHPRGELLLKTDAMFPGYYQRPEVTAEVFDAESPHTPRAQSAATTRTGPCCTCAPCPRACQSGTRNPGKSPRRTTPAGSGERVP